MWRATLVLGVLAFFCVGVIWWWLPIKEDAVPHEDEVITFNPAQLVPKYSDEYLEYCADPAPDGALMSRVNGAWVDGDPDFCTGEKSEAEIFGYR